MINDENNVPACVIHTDVLKRKLADITSLYSTVVTRTYGPYGANTLVQSTNNVFATKDGWTVASNLTVGDDIPTKCLAKLILDTAASVNLKLGDGTTTVIVAADSLNWRLQDYLKTHQLTSREIEDTLEKAIGIICDKIQEIATPVDNEDPDQLYNTIKKIALISTNWNNEFADMIASVYKETKNPLIQVKESGSDRSFVEIVDGFEISAELLLRDYYLSDAKSGKLEVNDPLVVIFDYIITDKMYIPLATMAEIAAKSGRPLIVVAPGFMTDFIKILRTQNIARLRASRPIVPLYPVKLYTPMQIDKEIADDLSVMLGTQPIGKENEDIESMFNDLVASLSRTPSDESERESMMRDNQMLVQTAYEYISMIAGTCEKLTVTDKKLLVSGLICQNKDVVNDRIEKVSGEISRIMKEEDAKSMISNRVREKRVRLGKLQGKVGVINVGGYGASDLAAKIASLDDAIKACQAAFEHGVVTGGCYAIPHVVYNLIGELTDTENHTRLYEFLSMISATFRHVISVICTNKYQVCTSDVWFNCNSWDPDHMDTFIKGRLVDDTRPGENCCTLCDIIDYGCEGNIAFNIITEKYDNDMIEPANQPIEILKGCMRLVLLAATSSQMIYNDYTQMMAAPSITPSN